MKIGMVLRSMDLLWLVPSEKTESAAVAASEKREENPIQNGLILSIDMSTCIKCGNTIVGL